MRMPGGAPDQVRWVSTRDVQWVPQRVGQACPLDHIVGQLGQGEPASAVTSVSSTRATRRFDSRTTSAMTTRANRIVAIADALRAQALVQGQDLNSANLFVHQILVRVFHRETALVEAETNSRKTKQA